MKSNLKTEWDYSVDWEGMESKKIDEASKKGKSNRYQKIE